jgi:polar amino acid transport system substrate-binding protein
VTFLAVDPGRAGVVDFSTPYAQSDFTYLVPAGSPLRASADADRAGIKIATVRNDASDLLLTRLTKNAELVRTDNINAAVEVLRAGQAQAVGAPRAVLIVQSGKLAGSRVLDDGFAPVRYAAVVPKGEASFLAYINDSSKRQGLVKQAYDTAGIHGIQVAGEAAK